MPETVDIEEEIGRPPKRVWDRILQEPDRAPEYIALAAAEKERSGDGRITAVFGLVGAINLPIIHYSVLWWRTLHQGQSIGTSGSSIDSSILWPLPFAALGLSCLFGAAVLMRMRAELAETKVEARMRRAAAE